MLVGKRKIAYLNSTFLLDFNITLLALGEVVDTSTDIILCGLQSAIALNEIGFFTISSQTLDPKKIINIPY